MKDAGRHFAITQLVLNDLIRRWNVFKGLMKCSIHRRWRHNPWNPFNFESLPLMTIFILFLANCVVLAIDAPLPSGDKTELTKQLVGIEEKIQLSYLVYGYSGIDRSVLSGDIYSWSFLENIGVRINSPPWKLPEKHVEYHGFCCGGHGVSISKITIFLSQKDFCKQKSI